MLAQKAKKPICHREGTTTRSGSVHIYPHMKVRIVTSNRRRAQRDNSISPLVKGAYLISMRDHSIESLLWTIGPIKSMIDRNLEIHIWLLVLDPEFLPKSIHSSGFLQGWLALVSHFVALNCDHAFFACSPTRRNFTPSLAFDWSHSLPMSLQGASLSRRTDAERTFT
jgi:hypothetical protein